MDKVRSVFQEGSSLETSFWVASTVTVPTAGVGGDPGQSQS